MSSLAISVLVSTPTKNITRINTISLKNESEPSIKHPRAPVSLQRQENVKKNEISRREVIGGGINGVILASVLHEKSKVAIASEEEAGSCEFTVSPSGLAFCDKLVGLGPPPPAGLLIKAHYVGKLENGKIFDSSYGRGKPLTFRVGVGEVIKGWDQGILGTKGVPPMLAGGKRTLRIPPELGYGIRGAGCRGGTCVIPPDSVLFFDVEFVGKA